MTTRNMDDHDTATPIRLFSQRNLVYKIGSFAVMFSFLLYMYSFLSSNWIFITNKEKTGLSMGILASCIPICDKESKEDVHTAIQAMAGICLVGYVFTIFVGLFENFKFVTPGYHSRKFDWSALFTGTVGIVMDLLYVLVYFMTIRDARIGTDYLINISSIIILFVAATMIICNNRRFQSRRGRVISVPQTVVHYNPGQPYSANAQFGQANYPQRQNETFLPQNQSSELPPSYNSLCHAQRQNEPFLLQQPSHAPPQYTLPPAYPGDKF